MSQLLKPILSMISAFSLMLVSTGISSGDETVKKANSNDNKIMTIPCGMVNCYLIIGPEQCILVDTGTVNNRKKLYEAVQKYNITFIILTHGHYDHSQNAAYLSKKLGAKIAMNKDDYDLIKNPAAHKTYGRTLVQKVSSFFSSTMGSLVKIEPFEVGIPLSDGQSLADFGIDGNIVVLKGHTKGSVGILLNQGRDFIVGDAMMNIMHMTEPFLFEDYHLLQESTDTIKNSGAVNIYFGHGKPLALTKH